MIYLDYSATTPLIEEAREAMLIAMDLVGNPSSLHTPGHLAKNAIESARSKIAELIGANPSEIIFTSGGSEANNTVTNIFAGQDVAVSAIEHPSLLESAKSRCEATIIPVDEDGKAPSDLSYLFLGHRSLGPSPGASSLSFAPVVAKDPQKQISPVHSAQPALISIMLANNEIGTINDIATLAKQAHKAGALFHTDATQALGKIPIDVKKLGVDYMTISAHKIGGPVGIGALYIKKGSPYKLFIIGGHQENSRRAGTYQTVNIAGFGAAAEYVLKHNLPEVYSKKVRPLRDELAQRILKEVPYSSLNTPLALPNESQKTSKTSTDLKEADPTCLPHLLNCSFEAAEGESIQLYLDAEGEIITSTGSACASGDGKPSHVIMATRDDAEIAHSSVRFSLGPDTTETDINHVMKYLPNIVKRLQGISTLKAGKVKKEDSYYGKK